MEKYFREFTKKRLVEMLCVLCVHPANANIVRTLQNKSYKELIQAIKNLNTEVKV